MSVVLYRNMLLECPKIKHNDLDWYTLLVGGLLENLEWSKHYTTIQVPDPNNFYS